jgi:hypothetical protein
MCWSGEIFSPLFFFLAPAAIVAITHLPFLPAKLPLPKALILRDIGRSVGNISSVS